MGGVYIYYYSDKVGILLLPQEAIRSHITHIQKRL